jgi:electron transport complex protein RnfD
MGMAMNNLVVTPPPHLRTKENIPLSMRDVLIALAPAVVAALVVYKWNALFTMVVCIASAMLSEVIVRKLRKKKVTLGDYSAAVTGLLLAMVLPAKIHWVAAVIAAFVAVGIVKELMGGLGKNIFNPALFGFITIWVASGLIASWGGKLGILPGTFDGATGATPLAYLKHASFTSAPHPSYLSLLFGHKGGGAMVEVGAFWVLLGAAYLLYKGVIRWAIPTTILLTVLILSYIVGKDGVYAILAGGVMLGAFFMATDWVTSPMTLFGQVVFGLIIGISIVLIRTYGAPPEGVAFSILIGNAFVPLLDRLFKPEKFGTVATA